jgi:hypothetical protein
VVAAHIDDLELGRQEWRRLLRVARRQRQEQQIDIGQIARSERVDREIRDCATQAREARPKPLTRARLARRVDDVNGRVERAQTEDFPATIT